MEEVRRGYSSTRTGRKTKDYGENLEYLYNAAVKYRKEKYKEDTEKKMYEPIQKYPAEQPSAGSDKQITKMLNYDNIVTKNDNIHLESE